MIFLSTHLTQQIVKARKFKVGKILDLLEEGKLCQAFRKTMVIHFLNY